MPQTTPDSNDAHDARVVGHWLVVRAAWVELMPLVLDLLTADKRWLDPPPTAPIKKLSGDLTTLATTPRPQKGGLLFPHSPPGKKTSTWGQDRLEDRDCLVSNTFPLRELSHVLPA